MSEPVVHSSDPYLTTRLRESWRGVGLVGVRSAPAALCLAAVSGVLYAVGFPPLAWSVAVWIALVPLLVACAALTPLRAAGAGMLWTTTMLGGVASFLPGMLSGYFGLPVALSWVGAAALGVVLIGIYVSAYAAWVAWLVRRQAAGPLLLAGGWVACEFARAHGALGNAWALVAYSQIHVTPLIQIADVTGPYGLGLVIAGVNACIAAWLVPALRGPRPLRATVLVAAMVIAVLVYGHWRLGQTFADGAPTAVAIVQGGAPVQQPELRAARLARHVALTRAAAPRPDLIVWPESAADGYLEEDSPWRAAVVQVTEETHADLILGGAHYVPGDSGTQYHNSVYLVRGGHLAARYDKHRLMPFGEDDRLEWLLGRKRVSYAAGPGEFVLPASALPVGTFLCVESMYPEVARAAARQGAAVLVNLSNDTWFGGPAPAQHQLDIAALRAVENRRYLVRAASTGFSAVIDPYGRTLAQSGFDTDEVLNATVRGSHAATPYQRWGDAFAWIVVAAVSGATLWQLRQRIIRQPIGRKA